MKFKTAVLTLIIFVILAGIHLFIFTQNINLKFAVRELKIRLSELRSKNQQLGYQVAKKENLSVIEEKATNRLKMVYPEKMNYILIPKSGE